MKKLIILLLVFLLLLVGCAHSEEQIQFAIEQTRLAEITDTPDATNTPSPTETPTIVPSPTPDPVIFMDEFNDIMDPDWQWEKENKKMWNLTNHPGWLEITASSGVVGSRNLLNRPIPKGDFVLETRMIFEPLENYQIAGLIIYYNANNYILFGRAYAAHVVGDGFYMDYLNSGKFTGDNFATAAPGTDTVYLRLRRRGYIYDSFFSEDGINWKKVGTHNSNMQAKYVGLAAGQSTKGTVPAQFDYFVIKEIY